MSGVYLKGITMPKENMGLVISPEGQVWGMRNMRWEPNVIAEPVGDGRLVDIEPLMRGLYEEMRTGGETYTTKEVYEMLEKELGLGNS